MSFMIIARCFRSVLSFYLIYYYIRRLGRYRLGWVYKTTGECLASHSWFLCYIQLLTSYHLVESQTESSGNSSNYDGYQGIKFGKGLYLTWIYRNITNLEEDLFAPNHILFTSDVAMYTTIGLAEQIIVGDLNTNGRRYREGVGVKALFSFISDFTQINRTHVVVADYKTKCLRIIDRSSNRTSQFFGKCRRPRNGKRVVNGVLKAPTSVKLDISDSNYLLVFDEKRGAIVRVHIKTRKSRIIARHFKNHPLPDSLSNMPRIVYSSDPSYLYISIGNIWKYNRITDEVGLEQLAENISVYNMLSMQNNSYFLIADAEANKLHAVNNEGILTSLDICDFSQNPNQCFPTTLLLVNQTLYVALAGEIIYLPMTCPGNVICEVPQAQKWHPQLRNGVREDSDTSDTGSLVNQGNHVSILTLAIIGITVEVLIFAAGISFRRCRRDCHQANQRHSSMRDVPPTPGEAEGNLKIDPPVVKEQSGNNSDVINNSTDTVGGSKTTLSLMDCYGTSDGTDEMQEDYLYVMATEDCDRPICTMTKSEPTHAAGDFCYVYTIDVTADNTSRSRDYPPVGEVDNQETSQPFGESEQNAALRNQKGDDGDIDDPN